MNTRLSCALPEYVNREIDSRFLMKLVLEKRTVSCNLVRRTDDAMVFLWEIAPADGLAAS